MIRTLRTIGLAGALALVAGQAQAVSSLNFIWEDTGTPTITVSSVADQLIRGNIQAQADAVGLGGIFVSFAFDTDLGDELDIAPAASNPTTGNGGREQPTNIPGMGNDFVPNLPGFTRNQIESTGANAGLLGSYDVTATDTGLISATRTLGSVFFTTNAANVLDDGVDVEIVILNDAFDAVLAASGANISGSVALNGGVVNGRDIPEPTAALLVLSGIAGLAFAGRRTRD